MPCTKPLGSTALRTPLHCSASLPTRRPKSATALWVARRRRQLGMAMVADRAFVGRNTITRVEHGDPGVSLGIYASVLFVLGLADRLKDLVNPTADAVGISMDAEHLP